MTVKLSRTTVRKYKPRDQLSKRQARTTTNPDGLEIIHRQGGNQVMGKSMLIIG